MLGTGVRCSSWGRSSCVRCCFRLWPKPVTQVAMYMGFTLGSAHTLVASRHALFIHGRCQPMSQASVIYRLATVCDAQCLRQVCRRNHPGICRPLRDPMAGWGSHTPPHSTPSCPRSRPLESTALQHGGRTVRSIAPPHTSSWSNLPPQRAPSPAPVQGLRPKSQAMPRVGGRAKKIKPVWILSQNGIRHVST